MINFLFLDCDNMPQMIIKLFSPDLETSDKLKYHRKVDKYKWFNANFHRKVNYLHWNCSYRSKEVREEGEREKGGIISPLLISFLSLSVASVAYISHFQMSLLDVSKMRRRGGGEENVNGDVFSLSSKPFLRYLQTTAPLLHIRFSLLELCLLAKSEWPFEVYSGSKIIQLPLSHQFIPSSSHHFFPMKIHWSCVKSLVFTVRFIYLSGIFAS